ncbi:MAG: DNA-binding protein [Prevotellaceae bacterium]|jgi:hypothetical protein|nr:DNA-binding protein [Prevotellaceae bacterium]
MKKVKAFIERGIDGTYGVYIDLEENRLNYGVIGNGNTAKEAISDFMCCYDDMKKSFEKDNQPFQEVEFEFVYDVASFLSYYSKVFSKAGLERITGINQKQLGHYASGIKRPRPDTIKRIEASLHNLAKDLNQVQFNG